MRPVYIGAPRNLPVERNC